MLDKKDPTPLSELLGYVVIQLGHYQFQDHVTFHEAQLPDHVFTALYKNNNAVCKFRNTG